MLCAPRHWAVGASSWRKAGQGARLKRLRWYHTVNCFGHGGPRGKLPPATTPEPSPGFHLRSEQANLWRLVSAYRKHGHRKALVDPLALCTREDAPELNPHHYDLLDPNSKFSVRGLLHGMEDPMASLSDIISHLEHLYCKTLSLEVDHIPCLEKREWLTSCYEQERDSELAGEEKIELAKQLLTSQVFDHFLAKKFGTFKRYSGEGAESMIGFVHEAFKRASEGGISQVVLTMPHRGRLNLLTGLLDFPSPSLFHKIMGNPEFSEGAPSTGDVPSHFVSSTNFDMGGGRQLYVTMVPNPSHLEAVNPVGMGKARARMLSLKCGPYSSSKAEERDKVLNFQMHGDAAFAAQGIVMESLALSTLPHYQVGGTLHLVVNNQLGFTTPADQGRSSLHCSDIGKMIECPILHVNGDYPEDVLRACRVAMAYRLRYQEDVIVDLTCYRRWGHNELDNPFLTQPVMYTTIKEQVSLPDAYSRQLVASGSSSVSVSEETFSEHVSSYWKTLNESLSQSSSSSTSLKHLEAQWSGLTDAPKEITSWDTGCPIDLLKYVGAKSVAVPETIEVHPRLAQSHIRERVKRLEEGKGLDWATAEAMAIGSLLYQGFNVRLSGQDVGRGTFSHRHAMLVDQGTGEGFVPLNSISENQIAFLEVANSPLSEEAVLGYEYGFSIESPRHLVLWEAQFGDFFNGAQVIVDTFVSSGESKWLLQSGLVMLLPHGYDGAGPEHSSCRIERFLQMCDSSEEGLDGDCVNMHVAHPTTPAQYFHLLRRQMIRNFRKPLIVASPKLLLRLPAAVSTLQEMGPGSTFSPVLGDTWANPADVKRVVLCSGKHYYKLHDHRTKANFTDTAIIRLELLCPFPSGHLYQELSRYPNAKKVVWSQEEPQNMGPWSFVSPRVKKQLNSQVMCVSRKPLAAPAVGVSVLHEAEAEKLLTETFS